MEFLLPIEVKICIDTLENAGYEAFCVGGAVRDMLLGAGPLDFDVTTNCPPNEIMNLFDKTVPTGIEHGTVTVIIDGFAIEVTTYRTEDGYSDSRHPDKVLFVGNIDDDLSRRDFTVNAIAYNPKSGIYDPYLGRQDLQKHILRTVGDPQRRFSEDALRIMRLFRFASKLDFRLESESHNAAIKLLPLLEKISRERIFGELTAMLCGKSAENANPFFLSGALAFLGLGKCDIEGISSLPRDRSIRFAALLILSSSETAVLENLRADNALKGEVASLLRLYNEAKMDDSISIKQALKAEGADIVRKYFYLLSFFKGADRGALLSELERIIESGEPYSAAQLAIGGEDIKNAGFSGREIGAMLDKLIDEVIADPSLNTREKLMNIITK
ncbi:MAG: CCA tRNA nucleotidyltransferase [Clostridia bacterium]|nr:CCA tRNA nucleotidyltransferase [Clostridia bacterium]